MKALTVERWPLMISGYRRPLGRHLRVVRQDYELARYWVAPTWIAWLYRALPNSLWLNAAAGKPAGECFIGWGLGAPTWRIGFVDAKQSDMGGRAYFFLEIGYRRWVAELFTQYGQAIVRRADP